MDRFVDGCMKSRSKLESAWLGRRERGKVPLLLLVSKLQSVQGQSR